MIYPIQVAAVSRGIRFDKVLEQVARAAHARGDSDTVTRRERKVQRLEELIRAQEAMCDRIVICLGLVLALSAVALPVYALNFSDGHSYLHIADGSASNGRGSNTAQTRTTELSPATTGSLNKQAREIGSRSGKQGSNRIASRRPGRPIPALRHSSRDGRIRADRRTGRSVVGDPGHDATGHRPGHLDRAFRRRMGRADHRDDDHPAVDVELIRRASAGIGSFRCSSRMR